MTLLELTKELNDFVAGNLTAAQTDIDAFNTQIVLLDGNRITWLSEDDYEAYYGNYADDVDETNYEPYLGCDFYESDPIDMW